MVGSEVAALNSVWGPAAALRSSLGEHRAGQGVCEPPVWSMDPHCWVGAAPAALEVWGGLSAAGHTGRQEPAHPSVCAPS